MSETEIVYETVVEHPRDDWMGRVFAWVGRHPVWAGLIGGSAAVGIAMARAFEGVSAQPSTALAISATVIAVWATLFYFLRNFFKRQAIREERVRRAVVVDDDKLVWTEDGRELVRVEAPRYELVSTPVLDDTFSDGGADRAWPVWLVVEGGDERLVFETKITAEEAARYEQAPPEVVEGADEELPIGVISPLLTRADRKLEGGAHHRGH